MMDKKQCESALEILIDFLRQTIFIEKVATASKIAEAELIITDLIEEYFKLKDTETNYEHYREEFEKLDREVKGVRFQCHIYKRVMSGLCDGISCKECMCKIFEWLSQPYEEPKPKIKLSQFEYDVLEIKPDKKIKFDHYVYTMKLKEKGYFKNVDVEMTLQEILDNCEVV